jgi:SAM-dependent methyltransferase
MTPDPPNASESDESQEVRRRYARRPSADPRYSLLNAAALRASQERERAIARLFVQLGHRDLGGLDLVEVGSGGGGVLLDFIRLGFAPERLTGIELLAERHAAASRRLASSVRLVQSDAATVAVAPASVDVVVQSTVFSSLLDDSFQQSLADTMWRWVKPGGGVLWYDFTVDNPRNPDVRGVPMRRVRALFPEACIKSWRITLAPPIARAVVRVHPSLYTAFNLLPALRTHLLCWIAKD